MSIRTPLSRVRGLGAAKSGVAHFWLQRLTALALVPLILWFLASIVAFAGADYEALVGYIGDPITTLLLLLLIVVGFYHMKLGLQVVVEDYIHNEMSKIALLILVNFFAITVGGLAFVSVLKISLG